MFRALKLAALGGFVLGLFLVWSSFGSPPVVAEHATVDETLPQNLQARDMCVIEVQHVFPTGKWGEQVNPRIKFGDVYLIQFGDAARSGLEIVRCNIENGVPVSSRTIMTLNDYLDSLDNGGLSRFGYYFWTTSVANNAGYQSRKCGLYGERKMIEYRQIPFSPCDIESPR